MKKLVLAVMLITSVAVGSIFAQETEAEVATAVTPEYFTFNIGSMGAYGFESQDFTVVNNFGVQLQLNEKFSTGFSVSDSYTFVNITASPKANLTLSFYTGQIASSVAFGIGTGYDFFTNKDNFFTAMGLYADWYACSDTAQDEALKNGGVIALGLKAKLGY
ncbi:MAG: hypothetical protein BKP49_06905 [Treponema sp. CETP13]|nr:MAG: hypothetical protein BKP49_06905 [Treponema sp. CETP13]